VWGCRSHASPPHYTIAQGDWTYYSDKCFLTKLKNPALSCKIRNFVFMTGFTTKRHLVFGAVFSKTLHDGKNWTIALNIAFFSLYLLISMSPLSIDHVEEDSLLDFQIALMWNSNQTVQFIKLTSGKTLNHWQNISDGK